jgi:hypothetical protein
MKQWWNDDSQEKIEDIGKKYAPIPGPSNIVIMIAV